MANQPDEQQIGAVCFGWSGGIHRELFKFLVHGGSIDATEVHNLPIKSVLVLGVYKGYDCSYLAWLLQNTGRENVRVVGVDLFSDEPMPDWTEEEKLKTSWKEGKNLEPPDLQVAQDNIETLGLDGLIELIQGDAEEYCLSTEEKFDVVYVDTSHDYETTKRHIDAAMNCVNPEGWIAGDDFAKVQANWGVSEAVNDSFSKYHVIGGLVWFARPKDYIQDAI